MAVGEGKLPDTIHPIPGFRLGTTQAHIKKPDRKDLIVMELCPEATTAAVFTQNRFRAAPVVIGETHLQQEPARYWVVNTGYANAGTGDEGFRRALEVCDILATMADVPLQSVIPFSTGVIGELFEVEPFESGLPQCLMVLTEDGWLDAAEGIMTTDTRPKIASREIKVGEQSFVITGMSKGAGMICPNMATMLGFVATDLGIEQGLLQQALQQATDASFNCITVDGDTSTNDACILAATGRSELPVITEENELYQTFCQALSEIMLELAHGIIKDGEGVTKFVAITVEEAASESDAKQIAYTVAHSPLVKTALFASDPNWGRILAAVGRAPVESLDVERVSLWLDDVKTLENGGLAASYREEEGDRVMQQDHIQIRIALGAGDHTATVWTSDFSYDYVRINADYRT